MDGNINYEGLIKESEYIKNIAHVLNSTAGFVITVPGGQEYEIVIPTPMEKDVRKWVRQLLMLQIKRLSVYTYGE